MKTETYEITINGEPAEIAVDYSRDDKQVLQMIRLSFGDKIACGFAQVRACFTEEDFEAILEMINTGPPEDQS